MHRSTRDEAGAADRASSCDDVMDSSEVKWPSDGSRQAMPRMAAASLVELRLIQRALKRLGAGNIRVELWDGSGAGPTGERATTTVFVRRRRALLRMLVDPEFAVGDCYCEGEIEVQGDLVALLEAANRGESQEASRRSVWTHRLSRYQWAIGRRRARRNIRRHYDLSNDFYRLWLDPTMTYSCAYFPSHGASLADAQTAKLDRICRKLALRPGERVIEAGCGWGSLAIHMAAHYGVQVKAYNISHEQIVYARERVRTLGLADRVEFVEDDYRAISGPAGAFVSVGMLEHIGRRHYRELGAVIHRCLEPGGRGLIHSIGRHRPMPPNRWMQRRIFPDGYVPSPSEMAEVLEPNELAILDVENLREHYARTLDHWLENFEGVSDEAERMFDQRFVRMWRLYLASSAASFRTGWHQLYQIVFAPNDADWVAPRV